MSKSLNNRGNIGNCSGPLRKFNRFSHVGAGLLSFVLSYSTKMSPPEIREASFASRLVTKSIVFLPYKHFPDFRWWFINLSQTTYEGRGFGRYWGGQNRKRIFEKTRVGFGRTELSLRLSCTEFCALSSGHGPRGEGFYGGSSGADFCIFCWAVLEGVTMSWK